MGRWRRRYRRQLVLGIMEEVTAVAAEGLRVERMDFHQADMAGPLAAGDRGETVDLIIQTEMCQWVNGGEGKDYQILGQAEGIEEEDGVEIGELNYARTTIKTQRGLERLRSKKESLFKDLIQSSLSQQQKIAS